VLTNEIQYLHLTQYKGSCGFSNSDDNMRSKDYVESLHQNSKSTLLYGKNNVVVFMVSFLLLHVLVVRSVITDLENCSTLKILRPYCVQSTNIFNQTKYVICDFVRFFSVPFKCLKFHFLPHVHFIHAEQLSCHLCI